MQFSKLIIAAAAFAVAQATIQFDNTVFNNLTAGKPFDFTWSGATGPVTIVLKNGDPNDLKTVSTVASGLSGTSYTWDVPSTLTSDTYAFSITDGVTTNYSPQVQLIGGASATSTAVSSSASGSSSTGSTSSGASTTSTGSSTTSTGSSSASTTSSGSTSTGSKTTSTGSTSTGSKTTSATQAASSTSAPGSAAGLESPLAFVFLALAAFFTLN